MKKENKKLSGDDLKKFNKQNTALKDLRKLQSLNKPQNTNT